MPGIENQIIDILIEAYPRKTSIETLLQRIGLSAASVDLDGASREVWHRVWLAVGRADLEDDLWELVIKDPDVAKYHKQLEHLRNVRSRERSTRQTSTAGGRSRIPLEAPVNIGILTALSKECAAMRMMLENVSREESVGESGGRDYYLGEIPAEGGGCHRVALALLPDMGNNSAAIYATQLLHRFPNVQDIIMCGIAGGVPRPGDPEHDVRLGDIVVSNRNGVVQYDLVKERPDGSREHRHPPNRPSARLLGAVGNLRVEEDVGKRPWEPFLARSATLRNGERPADHLDARGQPIDYPPDRERIPGRPRVFHATIAAANILLKNPRYRDYLGETFGVKAVEMEGSGIADAAWADGAGYLVVRGICDYCDENKGDLWQGAAAVAAAAYVRALIGSMSVRSDRYPRPGE